MPLQIQSDHSLWKIDLHTLGFPGGDSELQSRRALEEFNTVDFLSDSVVAATFVTQQSVPGAQRREDPNRVRPYLLHAVFLEAFTGKVVKTLEWPADDPNAGIFPVNGGGFVLFSGDSVALYSSDDKPLKEFPLPQLQAVRAGHVGIAESPDDKFLLIRYQRGDSIYCIHIVTEMLDVSEAPCAVSRLFSISDTSLAERSDKNYDRPETEAVQPVGVTTVQKSELDIFGKIQIREQSETARMLCDSSKFPGCKVPQFLNNEMVVVFDWYAIGLIGAREKVPVEGPKLQTKLTHGEWIDIVGRPVRSSSDGERFTVAINRPPPGVKGKKGSIHAFLGDVPAAYPSHVDVFDLPQGKWMYSIVNRMTSPKSHQFLQIWGLALSPDGEKLAIDSGGIIQVYLLPTVQLPNSKP